MAPDALHPSIRKSAHNVLLGPLRTTVHRDLERIQDEAVLRRVLLRLLQSGLPKYAQVRHGPFEYGKDVAALVDDGGTPVLRLYQAKIGEVKKTSWPQCRDQIEEMFLVPVPKLQLPVTPARIEAFLVTNGHASPHVEPITDAWIDVQRATLGRHVEFMHIDRLAEWIVKARLITELRAALAEHSAKRGAKHAGRKKRKAMRPNSSAKRSAKAKRMR